MKKSLLIYGPLALVLIGVGAFLIYRGGSTQPSTTPYQETLPPLGDLSETYTNYTLGFSVAMPKDFASTEIPGEGGVSTVLLQNKAGDGIQIVVTPLGETLMELTPDRIRADIPDLQMSDIEVLRVEGPSAAGQVSYTGVAFRSDNEAFGGDSREVWFPFNGYLYQISTYARLDPLLKAMFATWKFF